MRWLSLLLALQQALWIDVPFVTQDKHGCGSASIWMIMEYWKRGTTPPVEEIQTQLYSPEAGGIFARDMEKYLRDHGYSVYTFRGEWSDLEQHIAKGRPLIVCLERNGRGVPLHYVVVAGIDVSRNLVLLNDPADGKLRSMHRADFEAAWHRVDNWSLLAVPQIDLAGAAFREEKLDEAREHLGAALQSDPSDLHANEFLATVHFLQNNMESALKYWNRAGKPTLDNIHIDPPLRVDPVLLDRSLAFSRGSLLTVEDFRTTRARLDATGLFSRYQMELTPAEADRFDLTLRASERNGANVLGWFMGLPYQTVYPAFFNAGGKAINIRSILRWDRNKRRAYVSVSSPLRGDPKWHVRASFDSRSENWLDSTTVFGMRKNEAAVEFHAVPNGRWGAGTGVSLSHRKFSNSLRQGFALGYFASMTRALVRDSDRVVSLDSTISLHTGKLFGGATARFMKLSSSSLFTWRPRPQYEFSAAWRMGRVFGAAPFDELYVVGLERDSNVLFRAHPATVHGMKTSESVRRSYVVSNIDFQKTLADNGLLRWSAGPFLDVGSSLDTGVQIRLTAFGSMTLQISYGKSLTDARRALFMKMGS